MTRYYGDYDSYYPPYVPVAERRRQAARAAAKLVRKGQRLSPVQVVGRTIAQTFWGKAWCGNLEAYHDYENRLPRGRSYLRNGAVLDLQIREGLVTALVSGSALYKIKIGIKPLPKPHWTTIKQQCTGQIESVVDLLRGKLSTSILQLIARPGEGLFPAPAAIEMDCSCPDWAVMCKHVAAVLYGVGARLDQQPELLFVLRKVDHLELIAEAPKALVPKRRAAAQPDTKRLESVFGIELAEEPAAKRVETAKPMKPVKAAKTAKSANARTRAARGKAAKPRAKRNRRR